MIIILIIIIFVLIFIIRNLYIQNQKWGKEYDKINNILKNIKLKLEEESHMMEGSYITEDDIEGTLYFNLKKIKNDLKKIIK